MSAEKKNFETWAEVIKNYVEGLGGENLKDQYHAFLLLDFYFKQLQEAKAEGKDAERPE